MEQPLSPATIVDRWIKNRGYNQKQAARILQWKEPELSMVLSNRRPISERMARDLIRTFGNEPENKGWDVEDWMELQRTYLEWTKTSEGESVAWRARTDRAGILCDSDILDAVRVGELIISPFNEQYLQPASYDLTGGVFTWFNRRGRDGKRRRISMNDEKLALRPGDSVHVLTRERLHIPTNISARVAAVGALVEMGVLCAFGIQMDPGWEGQPFFTLFHTGDEDIEIEPHDACVSVEFHFLQRAPRNPYSEETHAERYPNSADH